MAKKSTNSRVEIQHPNAPMTDKQTYKLYIITGVTMYYMEVYPYTIQEASDLIDEALNGGAYKVRVETAQHEGARISWEDVGKGYRSDKKPTGYAKAMTMLADEDEVEEEEVSEPAQKQGKTKYQRKQSLKAKYERDLKKLEEQEDEPPPAKKGKSSGNTTPKADDMEAIIALLAANYGVDEEKLRRMQKAFNA